MCLLKEAVVKINVNPNTNVTTVRKYSISAGTVKAGVPIGPTLALNQNKQTICSLAWRLNTFKKTKNKWDVDKEALLMLSFCFL